MRKGGIPAAAAVHTPHGGFGVFSRATAGWCSGGGGGGGAHLDVDVRVGHGRRWRGARTLDWGMEGRDAGRELL